MNHLGEMNWFLLNLTITGRQSPKRHINSKSHGNSEEWVDYPPVFNSVLDIIVLIRMVFLAFSRSL